MARLLSIGSGTLPMLDGTPYPYDISISYQDPEYPIAVSEGIGHCHAGSFLRPEEILQAQWQEHLAICKCQWLVALVRQAREAGTKVTASMIEAAWRARASGSN